MYGLPDQIDLSFMLGAELIQVCIGQNEVILNLHQDLTVSIETAFRVATADGRDQRFETAPDAASAMTSLLGTSITGTETETDGTMRIALSGGHLIELYDDSRKYESYTITKRGSPEHFIVV